jgi:GntR family transcriptional regulator, vanillate catabolism transcriptional regulator
MGKSEIPDKAKSQQIPRGDEERGPSQTARATLALRELLVQGHFHPGERMREVPLAKQLGVSRIPLRLALERLAHEGFLEKRSTRGFITQQFSIQDIYDAIDLRGSLEGMAARLAAERLSDVSQLDALRSLHEEMVTLIRRQKLSLAAVAGYIECNGKFHAEVLALSQSRRLQRAMEQVSTLPFASPSAFLRRHYIAPESAELFLISIEHHRAIVEAIAAREGTRAESIAREHARVARRNLESALEHEEAETLPSLKLIKF